MRNVRWILVVATATTALSGCSDEGMSTEAYFSELETIRRGPMARSPSWRTMREMRYQGSRRQRRPLKCGALRSWTLSRSRRRLWRR